jgi:outer membrane protein OmpA-like peptidoglycan-associated protein
MPRKTARILGLVLLFLLVTSSFSWAQKDFKGGKDHPLFTRMPGTHINQYRQAEFDSAKFPLNKKDQETVEGRYFLIEYYTKKDASKPSALEIIRNHTAAIIPIGGKVLYEDQRFATMQLVRDGKEVWAKLDALAGRYTLTIVEKKAMVQSITAKAIFDELSQKGFMVIDVHFDTAQAVIKPESQPLIDQVAEMLKSNPSLKVSVEGHTDNTGSAKANQKLSLARARAVAAALAAKGIAATRLQAQGWGDQKPVADNGSDQGRAKNRRVELRKK